MWGPMGTPLVSADKCRCNCYCRLKATELFKNGENLWPVCRLCKEELEEALVPWLP